MAAAVTFRGWRKLHDKSGTERCDRVAYDADFDRIAKITGQSVEWIAEQGSL
jgi:hypothetical protein